jgi:hypothetical protein
MRRVPLAPREAVTLTLAIAREWDRQRALHGPVALPELGGIELTDRGDVVFLIVPPRMDSEDARELSALLGRLLGINEGMPRQRIPGGLLITMSGRLGSLPLPSATADGFRAALSRFADENPETLRAVYWRSATRRYRELPGSPQAAVQPRQRDRRRRTNQQVAELRRSIRALEQQLFESRGPRPWYRLTERTSTHARRTAVAAVFALCVGGGVVGSLMWPISPATPQPLPDTALTPPPLPARPAVAVLDANTPAPPVVIASTTRVRTAPARVRTIATRQPPPPQSEAPAEEPQRPNVRFAGGTRGIAWLAQ